MPANYDPTCFRAQGLCYLVQNRRQRMQLVNRVLRINTLHVRYLLVYSVSMQAES